jgi:hypothetical protein
MFETIVYFEVTDERLGEIIGAVGFDDLIFLDKYIDPTVQPMKYVHTRYKTTNLKTARQVLFLIDKYMETNV